MNILIVDDDELICSMLEASLRKAGHHVRVTTNPVEAIAAMDVNTFDLVVTDYNMHTQLTGMDVARHANTKSLRCWMFTSSIDANLEKEFRAVHGERLWDKLEAVEMLDELEAA